MRDDVPAIERRALRVGGVAPFTTTDFPGRLAAVVFTQGCPWRCRYCHNPHLLEASDDRARDARDWGDVLGWLEQRRGLLDGVVFSGGEPTAQPALHDAIRSVRVQGFEVGLHTGGPYPRRLEALMRDVDWVGLDIKAPREHYPVVTGIARSGERAFESLAIVQASGVDHEVRTTVHPALTPRRALESLARELAAHGVRRWVLQPFRAVGCADATIAALPRGSTIDATTIDALRDYLPDIAVR